MKELMRDPTQRHQLEQWILAHQGYLQNLQLVGFTLPGERCRDFMNCELEKCRLENIPHMIQTHVQQAEVLVSPGTKIRWIECAIKASHFHLIEAQSGILSHVIFSSSDFRNSQWRNTLFIECGWTHCELSFSSYENCQFLSCHFNSTNLTQSSFMNCYFENINFGALPALELNSFSECQFIHCQIPEVYRLSLQNQGNCILDSHHEKSLVANENKVVATESKNTERKTSLRAKEAEVTESKPKTETRFHQIEVIP